MHCCQKQQTFNLHSKFMHLQHPQDKKASSGSIGSLDPIRQKEVTVKTPGQKNPKPTVKKATLKADLVSIQLWVL